MGSRAAVGAEERGRKAAGVLDTEPVQGSGGTLARMACYTGCMHKDYRPWAWAFGSTRGILDRWGREVPGPAEEELNPESVMELVQWSQRPLELEQKGLDLLEAQEVEAGLGAGA